MKCGHYFVDDVGMQQAPTSYRKDYFRLGRCIICLTSMCADDYINSGEEFGGRALLYSPSLDILISNQI